MMLVLSIAPTARANFERPRPGEVAVRDVPGYDDHWLEARALVDAPPETVRRWLTDFEFWPARFHDVEATRVLERDRGHAVFRLRSHIMGREMVLHATLGPDCLSYEAHDGSVDGLGRIFVTATGDGRTDVIMQSMAHVGGLLGRLAPHELVRSRQRQKLTADLTDLHRLARARRLAATAPLTPGPAATARPPSLTPAIAPALRTDFSSTGADAPSP